MNANALLKAGYTHVISYKKWVATFQAFLPHSFPIHESAADSYLKSMDCDQYKDVIVQPLSGG